jgi:hypothetical protein
MERHGIDEASAFEMLREQSRVDNRKLIDLATAVVDGHRLLPRVPHTSGPPAIKASHARRTSSISGLSPIAMILAHPLAGVCGPFAVPFGARCGPFAVSRPPNSREHAPPMPSVFGDIRPCSLLFALL